MIGRRRDRAVQAALGLIAASTLLTGGSSATAQSAPSLGGYQGSAQADGVHVFYNPEGLLPIAAPVDLGSPDALATINTGPATFARASVADPGDLVANPDALIAQGAGAGYQPGTVPAYPYRVTASSGTGQPEASISPVPGINADVRADEQGSTATSTMPAATAPAIVTFGTTSSTATTTIDGSTVTVRSRVEISDLVVLGVLRIGSIITDLTATSDGTTTTTTGGTVVADATVAGMPVTIDAGGAKAAPGAPTTTTNPVSGLLGGVLAPTVPPVDELLRNVGIDITLVGPVQQGDDKAGQLTAYGLRIGFELSDRTFPVLDQVLGAIPFVDNPLPGAPGLADLITVARARHLTSLELARGQVSLSARPARPLSVTATQPAGGGGGGGVASATGSAGSSAGRGATSVATVPSLLAAAPAAGTQTGAPSVPIGAGVGALALLALLAQPFVGERLARAARGVLGADGAASCPWEER